MSEQLENVDEQQDEIEAKRHVSDRGPFEIWENPTINRPYPSEKVDVDKAADGFEYGALAEKYGEAPAHRRGQVDAVQPWRHQCLRDGHVTDGGPRQCRDAASRCSRTAHLCASNPEPLVQSGNSPSGRISSHATAK